MQSCRLTSYDTCRASFHSSIPELFKADHPDFIAESNLSIALLQAPVIMKSQDRMETKDR